MSNSSPVKFDALLSDIENALKHYLKPASGSHTHLLEAMSYSVLGGGKRLRPLLCCAACMDLSGAYRAALPAACALEFIHAYSLIHDDLPSMDNDKLRRGKATCHVAFDEATAVLAGDALQSLAFEVLANADSLSADKRIELIQVLARETGSAGMVGGQSFDMQSTHKQIGLGELEQLHSDKTGALIKAAIVTGAICANVDQDTRNLLEAFADKLGLAFQVIDDILDETQSTQVLGKQAGADREQEKNTFPSLMGLDAAQGFAAELEKACFELLAQLDLQEGHLATLTSNIVHRTF